MIGQRFDITQYISERNKVSTQDKKKSIKNDQFRELLDRYEKAQEDHYNTLTELEKQQQLQLQHEAIIGVPDAVEYMKDKITDFLVKNNQTDVEYPNYYKNLTDAIFQERYGLGPLSTWYNYKESQAAQVIGTDIYYTIKGEKYLQKEKFESLDRVYDICRSLTIKDATARLNDRQPSLEIDMYDGSRVTITIPPLTQLPTITLRHFVVSDFSLDFQAKMGTIPKESKPLFRALARTRPNIIISGPVRSGKSSFLKTLFAERDDMDTTICIETNFELFLKRDFPKRPIIEFQAKAEELTHEVFPVTLRQDGSYYIIGEIRGIEGDLAITACERGSSGMMATHHDSYAINVPALIARHIVDVYPGRKFDQELLRVAHNIDYVITMDEFRDGSKKVTSVQEIRLDPYTHTISTYTIMEYDFEKETWFYHYAIDPNLLKKMKKYDKEYAQVFVEALKSLAHEHPLPEERVKQIALESRG